MAGGFWGPSKKEVVFPHPGTAAWPLCFCHSGLAESRCLEQWVSEGQTCCNVVKEMLKLGLCPPTPTPYHPADLFRLLPPSPGVSLIFLGHSKPPPSHMGLY